MSASSPSLRRALAASPRRARRLRRAACLAIHSVGGHHRDLIAVFGPLIGGASIGTGLLAWQRRPENRFGALLVAVGFTYCLSGLIVTTDSWPFIAGARADRAALRDPLPHPAGVPVRAAVDAGGPRAGGRDVPDGDGLVVGVHGDGGHRRVRAARPTRC